jgi:hypothetical protein
LVAIRTFCEKNVRQNCCLVELRFNFHEDNQRSHRSYDQSNLFFQIWAVKTIKPPKTIAGTATPPVSTILYATQAQLKAKN